MSSFVDIEVECSERCNLPEALCEGHKFVVVKGECIQCRELSEALQESCGKLALKLEYGLGDELFHIHRMNC